MGARGNHNQKLDLRDANRCLTRRTWPERTEKAEGVRQRWHEPPLLEDATRHPGGSIKEGGAPMSNKPERVFQHGGVKAAIFVNEHEKDVRVTPERAFLFREFTVTEKGCLRPRQACM